MTTECTFDRVREVAEEETGYVTATLTTHEALARHVFRRRQAMICRAVTAWKDAIEDDFVLDVPPSSGWGNGWGQAWGGPVLALKRAIDPMEAVWLVQARNIVTGAWDDVNEVTEDDAPALGDPALLLRPSEVVLLNFPVGWAGIYDQVRLVGVAIGELSFNYQLDSLDVNDLIGPVLCRCLQLEAARFLALKADDQVQAGSLAAEFRLAQADFIGQLRAHTRTEKTAIWPRP